MKRIKRHPHFRELTIVKEYVGNSCCRVTIHYHKIENFSMLQPLMTTCMHM